ncbi:hypothetical protein NR798_37525 [Archangium gephyra]|uniref:hypothetical protein n=1 Tax=Archangium gephyra TaxID=48 RepID=UPI0035D4D063
MSSSKKWRSRLVLAAAVSLAASLALLWWPAPPSPASAPTQKAASPALPEQARAQMEARAAETARQRLAKMPTPVIAQRVGGYTREEVGVVLGGYREMLSVQGLYNQQYTRERTVARLLETPHGAQIAAKTLTDPAFAREAFGDFQAEARFFSIDVLKTAARKGDERLLLSTADTLARELSRLDTGTGPLDKGRAADLRDLMHAFIEVKGMDAFANGDARLLRDMGYSPSLSPAVKGLYDDTLFFHLKRQFGRERATAMTTALLDG